MQIEFTKEQYESLLKLIYCGDMMINGSRLHEDRILNIDNLCSYIYSKAKDFGFENKVDYWEEEKIFIASNELEDDEEVNSYIDTYDEDNEFFWENLIDMLVKRDLKEKFKNPLLNNVCEYRSKLVDFYGEEFHKNGIKNLKIGNKKS